MSWVEVVQKSPLDVVNEVTRDLRTMCSNPSLKEKIVDRCESDSTISWIAYA